MNKVKSKSRGSCGEFIQGFYHQTGECLVSCPIDWCAQATVEQGKGHMTGVGSKALQAITRALQYWSLEEKRLDQMEITIESTLPIGKGYASSTADMSSVVTAMAAYLGKTISVEELTQICVGIEPTDSTFQESLTLFNHIKGVALESYKWRPQMDIVILEMACEYDTLDLRRQGIFNPDACCKSEVPFYLFEQAMEDESPELLGRAMTLSALENQSVLIKPELEEILEISGNLGAYGINTAHSGSTVGIFFEPGKTPRRELMEALDKARILEFYPIQRETSISVGGIEIEIV